MNAKEIAKLLGVWSPKVSQLVLGCAGAGAWLIAIAIAASSKGEAVATAFVVAGVPLLLAAAFFVRVREAGKDGVKLDPEALGDAVVKMGEPREGVTPLEERRAVIEVVEDLLVPQDQVGAPEDLDYLLPSADRGARSYERALRLDEAAQGWLVRKGYAPEPPAADRGVDYLTRRSDDAKGGIYAFEVKSSRQGRGGPTPQALRPYFHQARLWADENLGRAEPFYRVLITDVVPPPSLRDRFRMEGIGIVLIEPDEEQADWVLHPRDSR